MADVRVIEQDEVPFRYGLFRGSEKVGQVDLLIESTVPNDRWLGELPPFEMFVADLELPWERDWLAAGSDLLRGAISQIPPSTPAILQANTNLEVHEHSWRRVHLFEALGFDLFQEKHGYLWVDRGEPLEVTIKTRTLEEVGDDAYRSVLSRIPARGLDRNDNYYYDAAGPENWASVMLTMSSPEDRSSYFIGYEADEPVGVVGLSPFDEQGTGTISYIGVLPEQRGRGLGRSLLTAANAAARQRSFHQILSDVDVLNLPMRTAMVACGHQPDLRLWHRWAHWLPIGQAGSEV